MVGYADSDFAADQENRKSVSGYLFMAGTNLLSWRSGQQELVTVSTVEAEYIALFSACQEARFLGPFLQELTGNAALPCASPVTTMGLLLWPAIL